MAKEGTAASICIVYSILVLSLPDNEFNVHFGITHGDILGITDRFSVLFDTYLIFHFSKTFYKRGKGKLNRFVYSGLPRDLSIHYEPSGLVFGT